MPASDVVSLVVCVVLALGGIVAAAVNWRRGRTGRVVQSVGWVLLPVALFLTGLLGLVVRGVLGLLRWALDVVFSPLVWTGLGLLALVVVLWIAGGRVAARQPRGVTTGTGRPGRSAGASASQRPAVGSGRPAAPSTRSGATTSTSAPVDDDMAEIEALLKSRGIE